MLLKQALPMSSCNYTTILLYSTVASNSKQSSLGKKLKPGNTEETKHGIFRDCFLDAPERTRNRGKSPMWLFRFSWNGPRRRNACFCFPDGNETPGFPMLLSGFVSIPPPEIGALREIIQRTSPDRSPIGAIMHIWILSGVRVQLQGYTVKVFAICLFLVHSDPSYY